MNRSVPMIGLSTDELPWMRRLVGLLRHPDPTVPELARQALLYLIRIAEATSRDRSEFSRPPSKSSVLQCME